MNTKQKKYIEDYAFKKNLILVGNPGIGKTHTMRNLYDRLPKNEGTLHKYWIDDGTFREKITAGLMGLKKPADFKLSVLQSPLDMCIRVKVLFFDDLGSSENVSEAQKTKLKFILDEREKKGLITIFSTNLSATDLSSLYGERIKSRLFNGKHKAGLDIMIMEGEDRRKEKINTV